MFYIERLESIKFSGINRVRPLLLYNHQTLCTIYLPDICPYGSDKSPLVLYSDDLDIHPGSSNVI